MHENMDDGFVEREDVSCIKFSKNAKLFLIRLPKEVSLFLSYRTSIITHVARKFVVYTTFLLRKLDNLLPSLFFVD